MKVGLVGLGRMGSAMAQRLGECGHEAIATGACNGVAMPATSGALASLAAAVAGGWGDTDPAEVPQFFRTYMLQDYE
jgi:predicted dinucleotide-binding enzyme